MQRVPVLVSVVFLSAGLSGCLFHDQRAPADPNYGVEVTNELDEAITVGLNVTRNETGETVHAETYRVDTGESDGEIYEGGPPNPDSVEPVRITLTANDESASVDIITDSCYKSVIFRVDEDVVTGHYETC